jgi:hypothetical protein
MEGCQAQRREHNNKLDQFLLINPPAFLAGGYFFLY